MLVLQETVTDGTGNLIQKIVYSIGHDHISQSTWRAGDVSPPSVAVFHFDGHGNTRILTDLAGSIVTLAGLLQVYHYDAYGNALNFTMSAAATQYLYSGEQFDPRIGQQYLRARYYDSATGTFNRLDPFFGNQTDPQSFHKYLYTHGDPVNGWDPSGETLIGALAGMSARVGAFAAAHPFITAGIVGFVVGIGLNASRNVALRDPWHKNWWQAGTQGAVLAPLALLLPEVAVGLALFGLFDSVSVGLKVLRDDNSTRAQVAAASIYLVANVFFAIQVGKNIQIEPPVSGDSVTLFGGVPRFGMKWKPVTDVNGKTVEVYGQKNSSSTTEGHASTIANLATVMAQSGRYVRVYMQRAWRTATGRENPSRGIPDLLCVKEDGTVDAVEVMSNSDTFADLTSRLKTGMESTPKETQGQYTVVEPGHTTDPFAN